MAETFMYRFIGQGAAKASEEIGGSDDTSSYVAPPFEFYRKYENGELKEKIDIPSTITSSGVWEIQCKESGYIRFTNLGGEETIMISAFLCGGGGGGSVGNAFVTKAGGTTLDKTHTYGGSGGGGGHTFQTDNMSIRKDSIFQILIGAGGTGATTPGAAGGNGGASQIKSQNPDGNFVDLYIANGGNGGQKFPYETWGQASATNALNPQTGGDGGSGGGAGGVNNRSGGEGGTEGSNGGDSAKYASNTKTAIGGRGDGANHISIPFGGTIGTKYGAGGAGACGCYKYRPDYDTGSYPIAGKVIFGGKTGGGNSGKQPAYRSKASDNKAFYGESFVVINASATPCTIDGKDYFKKADTENHISWADGYGDGQNGLPNTGGGGGGGIFRPLTPGELDSHKCVPVANAKGTATEAAKIPIPEKCYRGGDGGSGIVILHGTTDKKLFDYINNAG